MRTKTFLTVSQDLDHRSQQLLLDLEQEHLEETWKYTVIKTPLTPRIKHYLQLTSIPFAFDTKVDIDIKSLWPLECMLCKTVIHERRFMPTGNLRPAVMVVGDAPSAWGGGFSEKTWGRAWVDKPTSTLLRQAMATLGLHYVAWYSNMLKCSVPENRPSSILEIKTCSQHLRKEMSALKPQLVIALGNHVASSITLGRSVTKMVKVFHPSFAFRSGYSVDKYAQHISQNLPLSVLKLGKEYL